MAASLRTKLALTVVAFVSLILGVLLASNLGWTPGSIAQQEGAPVPAKQVEALEETSNAFITISRKVTPAVVSIRSERLQTVAMQDMEIPAPFEDFFQFRGPRPEGPIPQAAGGTGFIVREDGFVVTNNHVVEGAEQIRVELGDKRQFPATIVGRDPTTDIAVLKIEARDLPAVSLGDSDKVQIGEWVLAIGNPGFGVGTGDLNFTVTAGIVSARGRSLNIINRGAENPYAIEDFIQTDAAINPGNSGGPLVNIRGEVIGVNTAIATRSGFYQGYGFAIPTNLARPAMQALIEDGRVERAVLGIQIKPMDQGFAEAAGLDKVTGVFVDGFAEIPENPARSAGLRPRDVILSVNGEEIESTADLQQTIAFKKPGETVELEVWRDRKRQEVDVKLARRPEEPEAQAASRTTMTTNKLGMEVRDLNQTDVQNLQLNNSEGVMVTQVRPLSPAWDTFPYAGRVPVVITEIDGKPVRNLEEYKQITDDLEPGKTVFVKRKVFSEQGGLQETYHTLEVPE
jgi:serine protease Do